MDKLEDFFFGDNSICDNVCWTILALGVLEVGNMMLQLTRWLLG